MVDHIREMVMHGYDPNEHPFVVKQAIRIRELEAEVERLKVANLGLVNDFEQIAYALLRFQGDGRESGAEGTESPARSGGMAESRAAAYPAARKEASP